MPLAKCRSCNADVSDVAKICPQCGEPYPGVNRGRGCLVAIVVGVLIAIGWIWVITPEIPKIDTDQAYNAQPYVVLSKEDLSIAGRNRVRWFIRSDQAVTELDRAATVIDAASDLIDQTVGANEVYVVLKNEKGDPLATADYVFDKNPKWDVKAANQPYSLNPIKLK